MNSSTDIVGVMPPPPGVTPNFVDPPSIGHRLVLAAAICPAFAAIITVLRLYTSRFIVGRWFWDDVFIALALVFAIPFSGLMIFETHYGIGRHMWDVPLSDFKTVIKIGSLVGAPTLNLAMGFTKISILCFYLRFAINLRLRMAVYIIMFVVVGSGLAAALAPVYSCRPIARLWDQTIEGSCIKIDAPFVSQAVLNVACDLAILLLPFWLLTPLRTLPRWEKIGVTFILMTGGFVCAVSILRLVEVLPEMRNPDFTWRYAENFVWSLTELYVGIICACLPCLSAFIRRCFPNLSIFRTNNTEELDSLGPVATIGGGSTPLKRGGSSSTSTV